MSLVVWLPLNGNLENQGASIIQATGTNVTANTSGKIGSCYSFNGSSSSIKLDKAPFNNTTKEFSYCCWFKPNNQHAGCLFSNRTATNSTGITIFYYSTAILYDVGDRWQFTPATAITVNAWNHLAFTYKAGEGRKLYLNGILINSNSSNPTITTANSTSAFIGMSQNSPTTVDGNPLNGYLNDVRIYNHCLSAAEVHEISQGLVLHYKLDDITNGIQDSSGYGHNGSITGNITINSSTPRYNSSTNFPDSACSIHIGNLSTIIPEGIFTFNIWFKKITGEWSSKTWETILGGPSGFEFEGKLSSSQNAYIHPYSWGGGSTSSPNSYSIAYTLDTWHMVTMVRTTANTQFYLDGELKVTGSAGSIPSGNYFIGAWNSATQQNYRGYFSDARIYCTALSTDDIKQLYQVGAKVDNLQGLHTFEIKETNRNLFAGRLWSNTYSQHNPNAGLFTNFNSKGEYQFTANGASAGSEYIPINPTGHTYEYDYTISVNTGNQFYIGFERYDANKTARSNNACVYTYATKPSSDVIKQHFKGTVNLSTDGTNPCAFIALRILNGWSGTTSGVTGTATIHSFSLREIGTKQNPKLTKQGQFIAEELKEETNMKLHKNGIIETNTLIEK